MSDCIFCKIVNGEMDHWKLYEDEHTLVFLSIDPAVPEGGHTLVIPKKHYEFISDMPEEEYGYLMNTVYKFSKVIMKFGEGMNIIQNNGKISGQDMLRLHI